MPNLFGGRSATHKFSVSIVRPIFLYLYTRNKSVFFMWRSGEGTAPYRS